MFRQLVEQGHTRFYDRAENWEDAIRLSCKALEETDVVDETYKEVIIQCVKESGPYIVIAPMIALPHSQIGATGVKKTAVAFTSFKEAVSFEPGDDEKDARLFFTLASCNPDQHLTNIQMLSEILDNEDFIAELLTATTDDELIKIYSKYFET